MKYPIVPLGEVCDFVYGDGLKETDRKGGDVPVYGSNGIVGWHDKAITKGETLIVGRKGSIGEVHLSKVPCWAIDTTYYIDKTKVSCDFTWLYYTLKALDLTRLNKSAAVPGLNREDAYEQKIILPPLTEQKRIAALLGCADRLRLLRRTAHDLGDALLRSVFFEMFGDESKFDRVEFEEILAEEPKNGLYLPAEKYGSGIPIIRIDAFYDGILGNPKLFKRVEATEQHVKEFCVENGEILINRVNSLEYLGKCAFVMGLTEPTLFESNMMRIRLNREIAHPVYVTKFLTTQNAYSQIMQKAKKAVNQASINQQDVKSLVIPVPPLNLQEEFAGVVARVESLRGRMGESTRQVEMLFQSLLSQSFGGGDG